MRCLLLAIALVLLPAAPAQSDAFRWPNGASAGVALTYDDGIDVHLDYVMPDLEAAGLRGTFYVPGNSRSLRTRLEEWRAAARRGHELGNHTLFHPCLRQIPGYERAFVTPERALENYTVRRIADEIQVMNTLLAALDARTTHTLAFPCGDETAGGRRRLERIIEPAHQVAVDEQLLPQQGHQVKLDCRQSV